MSNSALAGIDAALHLALADSGMADSGTYRAPPANVPVPVRVYVDRGTTTVGESAQLSAAQTTLSLLREDVAAPVPGALVEVGGELFELDVRLTQDEGISTWFVIERGAA